MYRYKRNVSYIYSYRNGEKIGNVGYVRTEIRDNLLKLWLWIKDSEVLPNMKVNIYMFNKKGESFQVGDIDIKNGVGEVKYITRPENVFNSNMEISTIVGIGIYKDDRLVYKSVWIENEGEFDKVQDRGIEKKVTQKPEPAPKPGVEKRPVEDIDKRHEEKSRENRHKDEKNVQDIEDMETIEKIEEVRKLGVESYAQENSKDNMEEYQGITGIEDMFKKYPKVSNFENNDIISCIRIKPNDIGLLNMSNWKLGVNSFLCHGYYTYRYLILGKILFQGNSHVNVLGVPGVYSSKDEYLANLFGFTHFIPVKRSKLRTGTFGYWITQIDN